MAGLDTVPVVVDAEGQPAACAGSESFCVRLWQHMRIVAGGEARVCCAYLGKSVAQNGKPVSADHQSLMEIWNADTMRELRREMVAGRPIAGCEVCNAIDARGGVSFRTSDNAAWERDYFNDQRPTIDAMMTDAIASDFYLPKLPTTIEIEIGNICNLKCRMCSSFSSSRIAKDPVHRKWDGLQSAHYDDPEHDRHAGMVRRVGPIEKLFDEVTAETGSHVRSLYFLGGEPLMVREIPRLLERLVAAGRAQQISLLFISNGTMVPEWLTLASRFRRLDLAISVDGYGDQYEYIRYHGHWSKLAKNFGVFKQIPNVYPQVTTTIQVNNALHLTNLFRYLDSIEMGFTGYLLHTPGYLAVGALPSSIRRLAAARLKDYAEHDCHPRHRALVLSFAAEFEVGDHAGDPGRLRDFMLFTNDLDATRGQSIHHTDRELVELLGQAGYPWLQETLHAPVASVAQELRR
jgi:hypothetical protein